MRVYIVEDDSAAARSLAILLSTMGLKAEVYDTAEDFIEAYRGTPGCLLLDVRLPGMNGLELQTYLKSHNYDLPIVFMSGHADWATAERAMSNGAIAFLQKPFSFDEVNAAIQEALAV